MEGLLSSVVGSIASSVISGIFSKTPDVGDIPAPPAPEMPKVMPMPDDAAQQANREKKIAVQVRQNLNRASTILSQKDDKAPLGG